MSREEILMATGGAVALLLAASILVAFVRMRALRREVGELRTELDRRTTPPAVDSTDPVGSAYLITGYPDPRAQEDSPVAAGPAPTAQPIAQPIAQHIDGRLFADIVARESVVRAGGLLHGLRRALDPETRNRIRFEMKRELKRSRRQRRSDLRAAMRDFQARERAGQERSDEEDAA